MSGDASGCWTLMPALPGASHSDGTTRTMPRGEIWRQRSKSNLSKSIKCARCAHINSTPPSISSSPLPLPHPLSRSRALVSVFGMGPQLDSSRITHAYTYLFALDMQESVYNPQPADRVRWDCPEWRSRKFA
jgi:hypothetical protein